MCSLWESILYLTLPIPAVLLPGHLVRLIPAENGPRLILDSYPNVLMARPSCVPVLYVASYDDDSFNQSFKLISKLALANCLLKQRPFRKKNRLMFSNIPEKRNLEGLNQAILQTIIQVCPSISPKPLLCGPMFTKTFLFILVHTIYLFKLFSLFFYIQIAENKRIHLKNKKFTFVFTNE